MLFLSSKNFIFLNSYFSDLAFSVERAIRIVLFNLGPSTVRRER